MLRALHALVPHALRALRALEPHVFRAFCSFIPHVLCALRALVSEVFNFIKKETLEQVFFCQFCEVFKNIFFIEHRWWLLL